MKTLARLAIGCGRYRGSLADPITGETLFWVKTPIDAAEVREAVGGFFERAAGDPEVTGVPAFERCDLIDDPDCGPCGNPSPRCCRR